MSFYIEVSPQGKILGQGSTNISIEEMNVFAAPKLFVEVPERVSNAGVSYWDGKKISLLPERPNEDHQFNYNTWLWEDARALDNTRVSKAQLIEQARDALILAPIFYQGKLLDADERAQTNITNKINEFESRLSLGQEVPSEQLVWRDANNINTTFTSRVDMLLWLRGLAVSISERGTNAYAWSWAKKAEVLSATTLEEIDAVTLT